VFTEQDTLRGSITPERAWWDLTYYHLNVEVFPSDSLLQGSVVVGYRVLEPGHTLQLDLQPPMQITDVVQEGEPLSFRRHGNVYYIEVADGAAVGSSQTIHVFYGGRPVVSNRPPWDGGLVWKFDSQGAPFIATACQGEGASLWWPCKDHMYDEPDSMHISITAPEHLTGVGNGRLIGMDRNKKKKTRTHHWFVANPINNYGVNMNIADYVHFSEIYDGEKGPLDCDYYVLPENLEKAKVQFLDVPRMLEAFEFWFGPYPFYEDGYKLVEVPYPGMEHQSSVTYGNLFKNGFMGRDVSHTGWGDQFDFIIIHESGHEWFANNITYKDIADMWVHEGFTAYSESLFTEYHYGKDAGYAYVRGTRANISNDRPIIGIYDVNHAGSGDMYPKAANMLHTIRQLVESDSVWQAMLRGLNSAFYHQTVTSSDIENYMIEFTGLDLKPVFDQYLRDVRVPVLECVQAEGRLKYRWTSCIPEFHMPVSIRLNGTEMHIHPTTRWKEMEWLDSLDSFQVHEDFYVGSIVY
jgi:aminopeptidase N